MGKYVEFFLNQDLVNYFANEFNNSNNSLDLLAKVSNLFQGLLSL